MKEAFTLLEILVSIVILSLIIAGVYGILNIGNMTYNEGMGLLDLQQQARQAMDGMTKELRQAKREAGRPVTITEGGSKIEFYIPSFSNLISYYLQNNRIIRQHPIGTNKILASNIISLNFFLSDSFLQIQLQVKKSLGQRDLYFPSDLSQYLTEKVRLRNE